LKNFLKGAVIGGSMLLPGLSGGTMAILLGIYERLIRAVSDITKGLDIRKNLLFLGIFTAGGLAGVFCFSYALSAMLSAFGFYLSFLFIGMIAGTVPLIFKESGVAELKFSDILYTLIGVIISLSINLIPENLLNISSFSSVADVVLLFMAGIFIAIALILPGISVSYTLLILGIYNRVIESVKSLDVLYLLPIGVGTIAGILFFTRLLDTMMTKYKRASYMIITGFVISCIPNIFQGLPSGTGYLIAVPLLIVGFVIVYSISGSKRVMVDSK
jgi:putative membrane protein